MEQRRMMWWIGSGLAGLALLALFMPMVWQVWAGLALALPFALLLRRAVLLHPSGGGQVSPWPQSLIQQALTACLADPESPDPACLVLRPDPRASSDLSRLAAAVLPVLRATDSLCRIEDGIAVMLAPPGRLDLEEVIPIAARLQRAAAGRVGPVSIGFCLADRAPDRTGPSLMRAARLAADEARRFGPAAIRAFRPEMAATTTAPALSRLALEDALASGQIVAHFQPQVCAGTGVVTGVEALARWDHPEHGLLAPAAFLADLHKAGLSSRLTFSMLDQGLAALRHWQAQGLTVPAVSLNLDAQDLADPMLPDRILWELDRHDLPPHRLTVEVLETVLADGDPVTVRNIDRLARLGCGVDLDDFGTGQAAIGQLRRLTIRRIKIDRSFVTGLSDEADQRRVVSAILSMADRLGLDTLAEGVETPAEAQLLAMMGVGHLQGYAIARPLAVAEFAQWLAAYRPATRRLPNANRSIRRDIAGKTA